MKDYSICWMKKCDSLWHGIIDTLNRDERRNEESDVDAYNQDLSQTEDMCQGIMVKKSSSFHSILVFLLQVFLNWINIQSNIYSHF